MYDFHATVRVIAGDVHHTYSASQRGRQRACMPAAHRRAEVEASNKDGAGADGVVGTRPRARTGPPAA